MSVLTRSRPGPCRAGGIGLTPAPELGGGWGRAR